MKGKVKGSENIFYITKMMAIYVSPLFKSIVQFITQIKGAYTAGSIITYCQ